MANRLQPFDSAQGEVPENANVKLASVASDVPGASGRDMLRALVEGKQTPAQMAGPDGRPGADAAAGQDPRELTEALAGGVNDHHRFMLKSVLDQVEYLERQIAAFDGRIEAVMTPLAREAVGRIDAVPGFDVRAAQNVLAEIGTDMARFPTAGHLASWAGICPGNNPSAGTRRPEPVGRQAAVGPHDRGQQVAQADAEPDRLGDLRGPRRATSAPSSTAWPSDAGPSGRRWPSATASWA